MVWNRLCWLSVTSVLWDDARNLEFVQSHPEAVVIAAIPLSVQMLLRTWAHEPTCGILVYR